MPNNLFCIIFVIFLLHSSTSALFPNRRHKSPIYLPKNDIGNPLLITPYLVANRIQDARDAAEVYLMEFQDVVSYAGYFTVNETLNEKLFFWFFPSADDNVMDPVLLWLQGGPGCSSLYGLFNENGPFIVEDDGSVSLRKYSWHKNHSLLYIDQPVGTGFSSAQYSLATDQMQVGEQLYSALVQFFTLFPELTETDFFISGESYAGKYVPAIAHTILQKNQETSWKINLKGLLIGNGLSDPINQIRYGDLLYQLGFIDSNTLTNYKTNEEQFAEYIGKLDYKSATDIFNNMTDIFEDFSGGVDVYNFLLDQSNDSNAYETFLNRDDVREAIHVGNQSWTFANDDVYNALYDDISKSVAPWVSELLSNYRVLIYNGQLDIIVAYVLTENYLMNLNFSSAADYKVAPRNVWKVGDHVAGYVKTAGNLTEVLVRNAGHGVPADQPEAAYDLIYNFIRNIPLA